jgi:hypothetical protein
MSHPPSKVCESCGRSFEYRKKWARNWASVKYCSDACRSQKSKFDFRDAILKRLAQISPASSICPSDILPPEQKSDPQLMEHVRRSARLLAHAGHIEITQRDRPVDPDNFRGPIRIRRKRA